MARPQAWLELHKGAWAIRWKDPIRKKKDGSPATPLKVIDAGGGRRVKTKAEAEPYLRAYLKELPAAATQCEGTVQPRATSTLLQLATEWYTLHPKHTVRERYKRAMERLCSPIDKGGMEVTYPIEITKLAVEQFKARHNDVGVAVPLAYARAILNWAADAELCQPLTRSVDKAMARPQSRRSRWPELRSIEHDAIMAVARKHGHEALFWMLSVYGWRPVTACLAQVKQVDLARRWVGPLHVKHTTKDQEEHVHEHRLHDEAIRLLTPLVVGRDPEEPLFPHHDRGPNGEALPWENDNELGAWKLTNWYGANCRRFAFKCGGVTALKRLAVARMERGDAPWKKPMRAKAIIRYTGHASEEIIPRYNVINDEELDAQFEDDGDEETSRLDTGVVCQKSGGVKVVWERNESVSDGMEDVKDQGNVIRFPAKWNQKEQ